jgi:hypothetical protein
MIAEKVDFPFVREHMIKDYRKTLVDLGRGPFAAIACDQGGSDDYKIYNATSYAVELIDKELAELKQRRESLYVELSAKYGEKGVDKDWFLTMDGSVHVNRKENDNEQVDLQ